MNSDITLTEITSRLRAIRLSKSLSLGDVESLSKGELKAVVLGSYERGARTLSVKRALAIAKLYQVPVAHIFLDEPGREVSPGGRIMLDLRAINVRSQDPSHPSHDRYRLLARFAQRIVHSRQDWNGEVLSLRTSDLDNVALLLDVPISELLEWLEGERVLLKLRQS